MTFTSAALPPSTTRTRRIDWVAIFLFVLGVLVLVRISRLNFLSQDANWDLLNYHAYVPASLLSGTWFSDFHPADIQTYFTPYQDLLQWPLVSGLPAPIATAVLVVVQVSIFVPVGLILHATVPEIPRSKALGVGLIGASGAMTVTELGTTMGDIPPAILVIWGVYLLLSVLSGQAQRPRRRAVVAGILIGVAAALKLTVACLVPGLLAIAVLLALAGEKRSAVSFLLALVATFIVLYAPWALVLQQHAGSPFFPLFNAVFQAPRYPPVNFQDSRFPVTSLADLLALPLRQGTGTAVTAELQFTDVRWPLAMLAVSLGTAVAAVRSYRPGAGLRCRGRLPGLALIVFWCISYATWAVEFGVQRYAVALEVLALPVIAIGLSLALPRLVGRGSSVLLVVVLAGLLAVSTKPVDFGRHQMGWAPIVPTETIGVLTHYDAVLIAAPPLGYMRSVTRNEPGASRQVWLGMPFDDADRLVAQAILRAKSVGVLFYASDRESAVGGASSLGLTIAEGCVTFDSPLSNSLGLKVVELCTATPSS